MSARAQVPGADGMLGSGFPVDAGHGAQGTDRAPGPSGPHPAPGTRHPALAGRRASPFPMLTAATLVAANLVPLVGVLTGRWDAFSVMLLFWLENVAIGAWNVMRIVTVAPEDRPPIQHVAKLVLVPFFCVHYGMFAAVHGIFVLGLFGDAFTAGAPFPDGAAVMGAIARTGVGAAALAMAVSHGLSFLVNWIGNGEYRVTPLMELMHRPYGRVAILHLSLIGGAFLLAALESPILPLALLVTLKLMVDLRGHLREHGWAA
jgi:Family of unknown function (DUF6498)